MARATWDWEGRIGRRIKLRDLHVLSAVVRSGSMAKAASHLAMSQSSVSEAIASLEDALRVRLLDRSSHGIEPTIYANALLKRGLVVFDELKEGIKDIEFLADAAAGEVRIACSEFLSAGLLAVVIDRFSRRYPKIVVRIVQLDATTLEFRELQERIVDLALSRLPSTFVDEDFHVETLFHDPQVVVAGARSRWARRRSITLADLVNERWIFPEASVIDTMIREAFEAHGLSRPSEVVNASSILLRNQLLATGRFVSVLASSVLRNNAKRWSLIALPVDLCVNLPPISILMLKNRTISPAVQLFIEVLREAAKSISAPAKDRKS